MHKETISDGSGLEIRLNVSRVKVRDAHQKPWPCVCPKLPKAERRLYGKIIIVT